MSFKAARPTALSSQSWLMFVIRSTSFMCFVQECHAAFRWLTRLFLENITFGHTDMHNLLHTCSKLELLSLTYCDAVIHPVTGEDAVLTIDAPHSSLLALEISTCGYARIDMLHAPKLRRLIEPLPIQHHKLINSVPEFLRSNDLDRTGRPKHISPKFSNLKDVYLYNIFYDCDLNWTMFILEAAPSLNNFYLMLSRHPWDRDPLPSPDLKAGKQYSVRFEDIAEKVNVLWDQASPSFKHHRLNVLQMAGFVIDEKLIKYIRLVMERAVGLKRIRLLDQHPCTKCEAIYNGQPPCSIPSEMEIPGRGRGEETNKAAASRWLLLSVEINVM
ncbi:hypothetical protein EJB05_34560, partial [Eragrostis curvula]